jgi:mRNA interferase RelE/StbE
MKTIVFEKPAAKVYDGLPDETRESVASALHRYAISGIGDVKPLSGRPGYRMRVGDYRVIFGEDACTIIAIYIGRRNTTTCLRKQLWAMFRS